MTYVGDGCLQLCKFVVVFTAITRTLAPVHFLTFTMFPKAGLSTIIAVVIILGCGNNWSVVSGGAITRPKECPDQKPYLAGLLCELQKLDMFGMPEPVAETEIINTFDVDLLKSHIQTVYDTLRCSYVFSARTYMASVETLLMWKKPKKTPTLVGVNPENLTFTREASRMLATMFNVDAIGNTGTRDVMLIFYMHTERLAKHFRTASTTGNIGLDSKLILKEHRTVSRVLTTWLKVSECEAFIRKNRLDSHLGCDVRPLQNLLRVITFEKSLVSSRLTRNAAHTISDLGWERLLSLKSLTLNEVVLNTSAMEEFFRVFMVHVDWVPVMALLKRQLEKATRTSGNLLSQQIRSLSLYQAGFVQMIKVVFVRLALKYVTYLNTVKFGEKITYGKLYNDKVLDRIAEFEEYFQLRDDRDLDSLKNVFDKWVVFFAIQNNVQSVQHVLNGISLILIENDGLAGPMPLRHLDVPVSILIEDSVDILTRFIAHVKQMLSDINFTVIKSFIRIPTTREFQSLEYFETIF